MVDQSMAEVQTSSPVEARVQAFRESPLGRELKGIAQMTVALDLKGVAHLSAVSPELAAKSVGFVVNNLFEDLTYKGVKLTDIEGNVALALPNVNIDLPYGLKKDQKIRAQQQASGLLSDWQEAQFLRAALAMKGLNWRAMEQQTGLKNPGQVRTRLQELQDRAPESVVNLTEVLLGQYKPPEKKPGQPRLKVTRGAQILMPAAQYAQVDARIASEYERGQATVQTAILGLAVVGLGVVLGGCSSGPIEATPATVEVNPTAQPTILPTATETATSIPTPEALMEFEQQTGIDLASWDGQQGSLEIGGQNFGTATEQAPNTYVMRFTVEGNPTPIEVPLDAQVKTNMEANSVGVIDAENNLLKYEFHDGKWQEVNLTVAWPETFAETANAPRLEITEDQLKSGDNPISDGTLARQLSYFMELDPNAVSTNPYYSVSYGRNITEVYDEIEVKGIDSTRMRPLMLFNANILGQEGKIIALEVLFGEKPQVLFFNKIENPIDSANTFEKIFDRIKNVSRGVTVSIQTVSKMVAGFDSFSTNARKFFTSMKNLLSAQPGLDKELEQFGAMGELNPNLSRRILLLLSLATNRLLN